MSRFLFLDMDGVCNSHDFFFGPRRLSEPGREPTHMIDPSTIPHLNAIVERSGALVVISSSWRQVHKLVRITAALKHHGFTGRVIGKTGYRSDGDSTNRRGLEIQDWLDSNENLYDQPQSFVILDDSSDMGLLLPCLVRTSWQHGLLAEHVPLALEILGVE